MATLPIISVITPSALKGKVNGKIDTNDLVEVGRPGKRDGFLLSPAARGWRALYFFCASYGLMLTWTYGGTYRSFQEQYNLFLSRYEPCSYATWLITSSSNRKKWNEAGSYGFSSVYWRKKRQAGGGYPATAAVPGYSNHGWALAIDTAWDNDLSDGVSPADAQNITSHPKWPLFRDNVVRFGFSWELQSEPWHIRWVAGDVMPPAVRDFESSGHLPPPVVPNPAPAPAPAPKPAPAPVNPAIGDDDDMKYLLKHERAYDSRPEFQIGRVDPGLAAENAAVPLTPFKAGETRRIVVGFCNVVAFNVTVIGRGIPGFVEVSGSPELPTSSLVGFDDTDGVESNAAGAACPGGALFVYATAPCDVVLDIRGRG